MSSSFIFDTVFQGLSIEEYWSHEAVALVSGGVLSDPRGFLASSMCGIAPDALNLRLQRTEGAPHRLGDRPG
jgi:hypothetical protein